MEKRKQVLSCIQPTGDMHFGNYFGAVKNWVHLQKSYDCLYGVVDYHAMTMPYNTKKLRNNTWELIFNLLSTGIQAENLFIQSLIPEHAELGWIFNCFASFGEAKKMTQFKDKSVQNKEGSADNFISVGLFDYPILQAADILIYKADYVPVGKDQEQHLELSRHIAQRFNNHVGKEYFVLPETLFTEVPKLMSLADPTRKMSKSLGEKHYISLFEEENRIRKKVKSAVTDTGDSCSDGMSPGIANLFELLKAANKTQLHNDLMEDYKENRLRYVDLKEAVANALVELSTEFKNRKAELKANKREIKTKIKDSSACIRKRAQQTIAEVKELTGLMNVSI